MPKLPTASLVFLLLMAACNVLTLLTANTAIRPAATFTPAIDTTSIYEDSYGVFMGYSGVCSARNHWIGNINGEHLEVYAGGCGNLATGEPNPKRGVIVVLGSSLDGSNHAEKWYQSPKPFGILKIIGQDAGHLVLKDETGLELDFDIPTRLFVLDKISLSDVPTVTPLPEIIHTPTSPGIVEPGQSYP